ncbi:CCR4-NOT transcription complex subunit 10-like isoform X1 [Lytechinus variegatus]|uniref:CCR4-NOT transcription complex subunit 10-like isoform X1 n=1 Tax=Lytechinus variegatus TaxID=7654 RepID=UPI001BB20E46|nr:CCR4-NOT transcription complex subunit 10-like isoform X1 [Lytechinus variegatus]
MAEKDSREQQDAGSKRDESPSPLQIPAITGEEKDVSTAAHSHFEAGNYNGCVEQVRKLANMRPTDPKVQHNLAVALFYQSGCRKVDEYRRSLGNVCSQVHVDLEQIESLEDADQAIFFFNNAVLLHHLRQHHQAIRVLEKLFQVIEPLEEWLAVRILLLLIESYLITHQPDKALATLVYLEKLMQTSEAKKEAAEKGKDSSKDEEHRPVDTEKVKAKIHQFKTKCYLQLKHLKFCKREIKSVKTVMNSNGAQQSPITLFLKANFEFERQNNRKAIKLLNSSPEGLDYNQMGQCIPVMYYNNLVAIHYAMHKYHLGAHYARRALQENASAIKELPKKSGRTIQTLGMNHHHELLYNTGIVLLHAGRPLAAFDCLVEAVQVFPTNPRLWLRLAECCIAANKTAGEGETKGGSKQGIIHSTVGTGSHRKFILSPGGLDTNYGSDIQPAAMPVASLEFASLCLSNALSLLPEKPGSLPTTPISSQNSVGSEASDTASKQTGPASIPAPPGPSLKPTEVSSLRCSVMAATAYVSLSLGDDVTALENARALMAQPKISGSLQFLARMYAAEALLKHDQIGEAIQLLNPESVCDVSVLITPTPDFGENKDRDRNEKSNNHDGGSGGGGGGNNNAGDPNEGTEPRKVIHQYYPASIQVARAHMFFNLATTHVFRSEWDKARRCLQQGCSMVPVHDIPKQALYTAIYLELHTGNYSMALQMVKKQQMIPYIKITPVPFIEPINKPPPASSSTPSSFPAPIGPPTTSRPSGFGLPTPIGGGKPSANTWR